MPLAEAKESFLEAMRSSTRRRERMGNGRDEAIDESFPASDSPAEDREDERGKPRPAVTGAATAIHSGDAIEVTLDGGTRSSSTTAGRDRRDHQLHQHLEPQRDDRRRLAGAERGRGALSASPG